MTLPRALILSGLLILAVALYRLWHTTDPLPEYSLWPPGFSEWRLQMEMARVRNGAPQVAKEDTNHGKR